MSDYKLTLTLQGANIEVKFDSPADLQRKLEALDLPRVSRLVDEALHLVPHPPGAEGFLRPPSSFR